MRGKVGRSSYLVDELVHERVAPGDPTPSLWRRAEANSRTGEARRSCACVRSLLDGAEHVAAPGLIVPDPHRPNYPTWLSPQPHATYTVRRGKLSFSAAFLGTLLTGVSLGRGRVGCSAHATQSVTTLARPDGAG